MMRVAGLLLWLCGAAAGAPDAAQLLEMVNTPASQRVPAPEERVTGAERPLRLEDVLESVNRAYPLLVAALQEREVAEGKLLSARGEFDVKFKARAEVDPVGNYVNRRYDAILEQPTTMWGSTFYGGWRLGSGSFPSYDGKYLTQSQGEWRGGMRVPLFRDGAIDRRRADLRQAGLDVTVANMEIAKQRIYITKEASKAYWNWVAAGRQYEIAAALLRIAKERDQALRDAAALGQIPPIEITENQRAILQRQSQLVMSTRALQEASIELSLFLRDERGNPRLAGAELLPGFPEPKPLDENNVRTAMDFALSQRPELRSIDAKREQSRTELQWARNQMLPGIDVFAGVARDTGRSMVPGYRLGRSDVETGLLFELPFQRRKAGGKIQSETAKINQLDAHLRFARDRINAEIQDAASAVRAAYDSLDLVRSEVQVARQLEDAERTRFELGDTTLFIVNLRELATADAGIREMKALADYHKSVAEYDAAVANILNPAANFTP